MFEKIPTSTSYEIDVSSLPSRFAGAVGAIFSYSILGGCLASGSGSSGIVVIDGPTCHFAA